MANLGMADTLLLMVLALVVFGPRRLPQIGRQIGKLMYEFRKASNDFKFQMEEELRQAEEADRRKKEEEERQKALTATPPPAQPEPSTSESAGSTLDSPASSAETPAANPYSDHSAYPFVPPDYTRLEDSTVVSVAPTGPRIQPPSTGEVVAGERPGAAPKPQEPADGAAAKDNVSGANEAERSEPAAYHG